MEFSYYNPTKVVFGCDTLVELSDIVKPFKPEKIMLVTGGSSMKKLGVTDRIASMLADYDLKIFDSVEPNPSVETVDHATGEGADCDLIIGLGGGSVLDAGKAIAMLTVNGGSSSDYLEGKKVEKKGLPFIAVPTTSGTASEVTAISVLTEKRINNKKSFKSDFMYPDVALVDPALTVSMPANITAASGLDALTHAFESYVSKQASPVTESYSLAASELIWNNLLKAYEKAADIVARSNMSLGSMIAGLAFSNCGCGACHGLSYPLSFDFKIDHGIACAMFLPYVIEFNIKAAGGKYERLAKTLGLESVSDLITQTMQLCESLAVPTLKDIGVTVEDIPTIVEKSFSSNMNNNPRKVTKENLTGLLEEMLQ